MKSDCDSSMMKHEELTSILFPVIVLCHCSLLFLRNTRTFHPYFFYFFKCVLLESNPAWCHKGSLSLVGNHTKQVLAPPSYCGLFFSPAPHLWRLQQSISFSWKNKLLAGGCKHRAKCFLLWSFYLLSQRKGSMWVWEEKERCGNIYWRRKHSFISSISLTASPV